jgi:DNA-binding NtrC family response regulator
MKTEKLTLYVVDDNQVALEAIARELQDTIRCNVKIFSSAEDCIQGIEHERPDLILSDYYLDGLYELKMNGDQMLDRIKKKYPQIPVIMYSARNTGSMVAHLMKLGAVAFIPKEKNFIRVICKKTLIKIKELKYDQNMKWVARSLLLVLTLFIGSLMIVYTYNPEALPYFMIGGPVLLAAWALLVNGAPKANVRS